MMSKSNKRQSQAEMYDSEDDFVASDGDGRGPSKKPRTEGEHHSTTLGKKKMAASLPSSGTGKVDSNGDMYWEISRLRRVTISTFRGKTMVNIREYYEKDGQELPGKKGISMPIDQFATFVTLLPEIDTVLSRKGESVPRPDYNRAAREYAKSSEANEKGNGNDKTQGTAASGRKNIEATSEEDEGEE